MSFDGVLWYMILWVMWLLLSRLQWACVTLPMLCPQTAVGRSAFWPLNLACCVTVAQDPCSFSNKLRVLAVDPDAFWSFGSPDCHVAVVLNGEPLALHLKSSVCVWFCVCKCGSVCCYYSPVQSLAIQYSLQSLLLWCKAVLAVACDAGLLARLFNAGSHAVYTCEQYVQLLASA